MSATPTKPSSRSAHERELFLNALELPSGREREALLASACGDDLVLRANVEALLQNHCEDAFLETPVADSSIAERARATASRIEKVGAVVGRYKLLEKIGEGGCGVVYMAEQEVPVRRRVALKVIKLGMDTKRVITRFEAEQQALAMMDHPNIAKVLDAGATAAGRPYFVMELVRGVRITEFCEKNALATKERLQLFVQVCQAIQHAHQKGVIHRDIKPSNILVTLHDGVPVPKVIDFGIAKATEQRLTDKTLFTAFQTFVGTPAYTSPEQAEMSGLDIDTRSDIYSLGVLLYELLTGQTPFDPERLSRSSLDEMRRIIREEEPIRPSTQLSRNLMAADKVGRVTPCAPPAKISSHEDGAHGVTRPTTKAEPGRASSRGLLQVEETITQLRGDVDWIVMKCLEKDRVRRYVTVNALAMDVQRYLNCEPITARPPSRVYQFQKFVRRNRVMVTASVAVAVVLIAATVVSSWQAFRATLAKQEQARLRQAAEQAKQNETLQRQRAEKEEFAAQRRAYNSDMNLVQQALAANNLGRAVALLNRHRKGGFPTAGDQWSGSKTAPPDFRQWEWRYFWNQSHSEAAFALPRQTRRIAAVAISPNGRLLASNDDQGILKLWDLTRGQEVFVLRERGSGSSPFAFSRDGERFAAVVNEGFRRSTVKVWALATRQVIAEIAHDSGILALAFASGDTRLLTFSPESQIRSWDFSPGRFVTRTPPRETIRGSPESHNAMFSRDGKLVAIGEAGRVRVLDAETAQEKSSFVAFKRATATLAFSPDGETLAVSPHFTDTETTIKLFSVATGRETGQLTGHVSWIPDLKFTPDGQRLISAGTDQTIRIWDVKERRELAALRGHLSEVNCVAVSSDGKTIVSGSKDGTLFGWDAERGERKKSFALLLRSVSGIEFFPDSRALLSVNSDGTVTLWDTATLQERESVSALGNEVERIIISRDGTRLYAASRRGQVKVLDWTTRLIVTNLTGIMARGRASGLIAPVDDGRQLVTLGPDGEVRLWNTTTWQPKTAGRLSAGMPPRSQPVLSQDGRLLVSAASNGTLELLDLHSGQQQTIERGSTWPVGGIAFSPEGQWLVTASQEGTIDLWHPGDRVPIDVLRGHLLGVHAVAFSPNSQRLASASAGHEAIKLWDVATRHEVATLAGEGSLFNRVKFSPDGQWLVAINTQGQAHFWRAPTLQEIEQIELAKQH